MAIKSGLVYSRLLFSPLTHGITLTGAGGVPAVPDEGYKTEDDEFLLLESDSDGVDSYLLEGAFIFTEDSAASPNETIILSESGTLIEQEQGAA